ncbi:FG-GAP repeat domain-containing protein [Membranihabitans marinus]|uniref:FG-GAP repeat domain-containing protein n=1 Tax=Membranihabitans marinus TaxID=1227546 RepID=UPI001F3CAAEC|nr:VCBS repeat-containing protein [Membranihabitans marinus]
MRLFYLFTLVMSTTLFTQCSQTVEQGPGDHRYREGVEKMRYNNPDLLVDLDVGFKSVPMPMDFDGDGDLDLLVSASGSYVESGVHYFENISGNVDMPVYRQGDRMSSDRFRLGHDGKYFAVSEVEGKIHVLTPDRVNESLKMYESVPENVFWKNTTLSIPPRGYVEGTGNNTWKMIDFDGDDLYDLVCGLSANTGNYLLFFKNVGSNEDPKYNDPETILMENGEILGKELYLEVPLADYDNDGDLDYVAIMPFAQIMYFQNKGNRQQHRFTTGRKLTYEGEDIQMYTRYGNATKLRAVDLDGDGYIDIIAGDEEGKVSFIKNTGKVIDGMPQFMQPRFLQQKAKYLDLGALVAPRVFDWDNDGYDDIVTGNGAGDILFVKNLGGAIPRWDRPQMLEVDGQPLRIIPTEALPNTEDPHWGYTTLDVGDWDGDDVPDLLVNEHNGNIVFVKNNGSRSQADLVAPVPIEVEWEGQPQKPAWTPGVSQGNELLAPWRTSPYMMDFNGDDLMDLVMLDYQGYLVVYPRFKEDGMLKLGHPQRDFVDPSGQPILLNQRINSSHGRLKITFADWDGDGLEDLVFSSKPAVDWMKNVGRKDGKIVLQYMGRVVSRTMMGHTDGPVVSDFNRDGILDLLVGTETGVVYYWERSSEAQTTTMTTVGKQEAAKYPYFKR